jgi:hypothetical protein
MLASGAASQAQSADQVFAVKRLSPAGESINIAQSAALLRSALNIVVVDIPLAAQAGVIVFKPPAGSSPASFSRRLSQFLEKNRAEFQKLPVSITPDGLSVPTGRVIVQFKDDVDTRQVQKSLGESALKVVQPPTRLRPTRYVVEATPGTPQRDPLELAKTMASRPDVAFAEPDMLSVQPGKAK